MDMAASERQITSIEELEALYDKAIGPSIAKEIDHISDHYRAFIEKAPFFVIATSGPGGLDCSPRGDPAGFVRVLDKKRVLIPDRRGKQPARLAAQPDRGSAGVAAVPDPRRERDPAHQRPRADHRR
jgi:predicted pyridoxine 5'-phosphate oxidase superfamily flavin-nucleotide-binding protein